MNENSYVKLYKQTVKELCLAKLAKIDVERKARWTKAIESFKACRQWFKDRGFFWLKMDLTENEWKQQIYLKKTYWDYEPYNYFWGEDTCLNLLKASKSEHINDLMYLCIDDYQDITISP